MASNTSDLQSKYPLINDQSCICFNCSIGHLDILIKHCMFYLKQEHLESAYLCQGMYDLFK